MEYFSTAYLFYIGLQILVVSWTRLFFTAKVFLGGDYIDIGGYQNQLMGIN